MARTHGNKEIKALFKELERLGFIVESKGNGFRILPPRGSGKPTYRTHGTPKAIKAIYSDFRKIYGVELDPKWK